MKKYFIIFVQVTFLIVVNKLGYFLVDVFHLPVPGNVLGMLILFILLLFGIIPIGWIEQGSSLLLKHLAFFFIPIAVGLMDFGHLFLQNGLAFALGIVGSIVIGMVVTGFVSQTLADRKEGRTVHEHRHHTA